MTQKCYLTLPRYLFNICGRSCKKEIYSMNYLGSDCNFGTRDFTSTLIKENFGGRKFSFSPLVTLVYNTGILHLGKKKIQGNSP